MLFRSQAAWQKLERARGARTARGPWPFRSAALRLPAQAVAAAAARPPAECVPGRCGDGAEPLQVSTSWQRLWRRPRPIMRQPSRLRRRLKRPWRRPLDAERGDTSRRCATTCKGGFARVTRGGHLELDGLVPLAAVVAADQPAGGRRGGHVALRALRGDGAGLGA